MERNVKKMKIILTVLLVRKMQLMYIFHRKRVTEIFYDRFWLFFLVSKKISYIRLSAEWDKEGRLTSR